MKLKISYLISMILLVVIIFSLLHSKRNTIERFESNTDKVSVQLMGGFGNRVFQILAGLQYAEKNNKEFVICKENSSGNEHEEDSDKHIQRMFSTVRVVPALEYKKKFSYVDKPFTYVEIPHSDGNVLLEGYFQTERYFPSEIPVIRTTYYPNTYFIHIRAGDYINNPVHHINLESYYAKCITMIKNKDPFSKFLVFSNDNQYAKTYLNKYKIEYKLSKSKAAYDTLVEMANCAGAICANSSLSWLGAFFQKRARDMVYMPSKWINGKTTDDLYPSWATIVDVQE